MNHADVTESLREYAKLTANPAQTEEVVGQLIYRAQLELVIKVLQLASKHHITDCSPASISSFLDTLERLP